MKRIAMLLTLLLALAGLTRGQTSGTAVSVPSTSPYGADGSVLPVAGPASVPSYMTLFNVVGGNLFSWGPDHNTWYNANYVRFVVAMNGTHRITLFLQDYDMNNPNLTNTRKETVTVTTPTGTVLTSTPVVNFSKGVYLSWEVTGSVVINVTNDAVGVQNYYGYYQNAVVNGVFFDTPAGGLSVPTEPLLPTLIKSVTINIAPVSGATSYNLYRGTVTGGPYPVLVGTTSTLVNGSYSVTDTTVVPGTRYFYVSTSVNSSGQSGFSPEVQVVAP